MACISTSTIARLPGLGANAQLDVAGHWFAEAPFEARDFNLGNHDLRWLGMTALGRVSRGIAGPNGGAQLYER